MSQVNRVSPLLKMRDTATLFCNRIIGMSAHSNPFVRGIGEVLGVALVLLSLAWILCVEMPAKVAGRLVMCVVILCVATTVFSQRGTGSNPAAVASAPADTMFAPALTVIQPPVNKTNLFYNVGLVWDAAPSALTTGYRIRYGTNTAGAFTHSVTTTNTFCTVSNLAFKPTWYFQAFTLMGTNISEGSNIVQVQPPLEAGFVLSAVFPLYSSSNLVNWVTNKIVTLVLTNPPGHTYFRSHLRQLDYQWTNNQIALRPFPKL